MSQRVNITYSVNVEDLPTEVMQLIQKATTHIDDAVAAVKWLSEKNILSSAALEQIDQMRRQLAAMDISLLDASNIVEGYLNYQSQNTPEVPREEPIPQEPELSSLIEEFRNSLGEIDEITPPQQTQA